MNDRTGNEPELSGARRKKEAQQLADAVSFAINIHRALHPDPNIVSKGGSSLVDPLLDIIEKRLAEREEDTKNSPMIGRQRRMKMKQLHVKVAGVSFNGRQEILSRLRGDEAVRIVPEPTNPHDPNALAVHVAMAGGTIEHVGYVPRQLAAEIAPALDGESVMCEIERVTGGFETYWGEMANLGLVLRVEVPDTGEDEWPF